MSDVQLLLKAKAHSDKGEYAPKHRIIRDSVAGAPDEWVVDSVEGNIVGLTHTPSGFRIHVPRKKLPMGFPLRKRKIATTSETGHNKVQGMNKSAFIKSASLLVDMEKQAAGKTSVVTTVPSVLKQVTGRVVDPLVKHSPKSHLRMPSMRNALLLGGVTLGGHAVGSYRGYGQGYDHGQQSGFNTGQEIGKQFGYSAAANQAGNTGFLSRLMGNYDFDPSVLNNTPAPSADDFSTWAKNDPNRRGTVRRLIGL